MKAMEIIKILSISYTTLLIIIAIIAIIHNHYQEKKYKHIINIPKLIKRINRN